MFVTVENPKWTTLSSWMMRDCGWCMPLPSGTVFNAQLGSETAVEDESTDLLGRQGRADIRQEDANVHLDTFCVLLREVHYQVCSAWTGTILTGKHAYTHTGLGENTFEREHLDLWWVLEMLKVSVSFVVVFVLLTIPLYVDFAGRGSECLARNQ